MTAEQLIRNILERAIEDGIVFPASRGFDDPEPQQRTDEELAVLAKMVERWVSSQTAQH